jgi:hypothetical protein
MKSTKEILDALLYQISELKEVQSIGISGGMNIPGPGEGDIDVFLYCDELPEAKVREQILLGAGSGTTDAAIGVFSGGNWGTGDFLRINGVETWLMYFTINETLTNVEDILAGSYPDRLGEYYPIGRLAMLQKIYVLYDKTDFLEGMKRRLAEYPEHLADKLFEYHLGRLEDREDFERAVSRGDVLFYHVTLDHALDHFLQALFSLNKIFFPSRKRSLEYIKKFRHKPKLCEDKLLEIIRLGSSAEQLESSYQLFDDMLEELKALKNLS